jgi:hypothetical protein
VTGKTLRKRLWRGQVPGVQLDGQWFVYADPLDQDGVGRARGSVPDTAGPPAGPSCSEQDREPDTPPLVEQLQSENAWLRGEREPWRGVVAARPERRREAHMLLVQEPALPAPSEPQSETVPDWGW